MRKKDREAHQIKWSAQQAVVMANQDLDAEALHSMSLPLISAEVGWIPAAYSHQQFECEMIIDLYQSVCCNMPTETPEL